MRKVIVFNQVSIDGFFVDNHGDMSWAHKGKDDAEWNEFVGSNASGGGELVFGRVTYEMMIKYWPTPQAARDAPAVAEGMNNLPKVVFSTTLNETTWKNTRLVKSDLPGEIQKMKNASGPDIVIMGSGTIVSQLTQAKLIDEYQVVVNPIVLGAGRTMFEGVTEKILLTLTSSRAFKNGNTVLDYELKK